MLVKFSETFSRNLSNVEIVTKMKYSLFSYAKDFNELS